MLVSTEIQVILVHHIDKQYQKFVKSKYVLVSDIFLLFIHVSAYQEIFETFEPHVQL